MEHLKISNYKELAEYKSKLKDKKWLSSVQFDISKAEMPTIRITGEYFHSSLDYNTMQAFCILQDEIYRRYAEYKYGRRNKGYLSIEEKIALELFIEVEEGSTIVKLLLPHLVQPGMNYLAEVTGNDIFLNEALIIAASVFVEFLCIKFDKDTENDKHENNKAIVKYKKETSNIQFWKLFSKTKTIEKIEVDGEDVTEIIKKLKE